MKKTYLSVLLGIMFLFGHAQQMQWSVQSSGTYHYYSKPFIKVHDEHAVTAINFDQSISIGSYSLTDTSICGMLARFTPNGQVEWAAKLPGVVTSLTIDGEGYIYVCGEQKNANTDINLFLIKYSSAGDPLFTKVIGAAGDDRAPSLTTDAAGKVWFSANTAAAGTNGNYTYQKGFFTARLNSGCEPEIMLRGRGSRVYGMQADKLGNVYTLGVHYGDTTYFESLHTVNPVEYAGSYYSIKIDGNGVPIKIKMLETTYKTGQFLPVHREDGSVLAVYMHTYGGTELELFPLNNNYIGWRRVVGEGDLLVCTKDIQYEDESLILLSGFFTTGNSAWGGSPFEPGRFCNDSIYHESGFVFSTDINGSCPSHPLITIPYASIEDIEAGTDGIFISGIIPQDVNVGDTTSPASPVMSFFIARYSRGNIPLAIAPENKSESELAIYPNPSNGKFYIETGGTEKHIIVYDILGNKVAEVFAGNKHIHEMDLSGQSKGIYFAEYFADGKRKVKKLVLN